MRARAIITFGLILAGQGASALVPPMPCGVDMMSQRLIPEGEITNWDAIYDTYPESLENEFVTFHWWDSNERWNAVLQHCPSSQFLYVVTNAGEEAPVEDRFRKMLTDSQTFTLRQIGEELAPLGAGVRVGEGQWGNCACDYVGYGG